MAASLLLIAALSWIMRGHRITESWQAPRTIAAARPGAVPASEATILRDEQSGSPGLPTGDTLESTSAGPASAQQESLGIAAPPQNQSLEARSDYGAFQNAPPAGFVQEAPGLRAAASVAVPPPLEGKYSAVPGPPADVTKDEAAAPRRRLAGAKSRPQSQTASRAAADSAEMQSADVLAPLSSGTAGPAAASQPAADRGAEDLAARAEAELARGNSALAYELFEQAATAVPGSPAAARATLRMAELLENDLDKTTQALELYQRLLRPPLEKHLSPAERDRIRSHMDIRNSETR